MLLLYAGGWWPEQPSFARMVGTQDGLLPSFSAQVRFGEPGAPVQNHGPRFTPSYGLSLVKTWSLEMSLNITKAAKISSTTKAAW
jgi:hypothetical protein